MRVVSLGALRGLDVTPEEQYQFCFDDPSELDSEWNWNFPSSRDFFSANKERLQEFGLIDRLLIASSL
jgi:hypothetical protein